METKRPLQLLAFNHVSRVCSDLEKSYGFYTDVLGFKPVKRPTSFDFEGAWLFNYGVGLHLIKGSPLPRSSDVNPMSCHISFQAASLEEVERCLKSWGLKYVKNVFMEDGIQIGQLFFHDPDNNMIEVCNCDQLPVVQLTEDILACAARPPPISISTAPQAHSSCSCGETCSDTASACGSMMTEDLMLGLAGVKEPCRSEGSSTSSTSSDSGMSAVLAVAAALEGSRGPCSHPSGCSGDEEEEEEKGGFERWQGLSTAAAAAVAAGSTRPQPSPLPAVA
ncbi:hypothetical protein Agub_g14596 [Astrephomene gubernaculifera]|uniref:VOC domain-containing protein n=1 Tax=Astrephomene gubernaculifera TaxID=47775 RepID=A0AAD3E471_9CHLO|nr:hypothetical protein Agub_g14596 [Astrephomene gubernaculifera]